MRTDGDGRGMDARQSGDVGRFVRRRYGEPAAIPATRRDRIAAASAQGLAAQEPPRRERKRTRQAMLLEGGGGVVRTARLKPAGGRQEARQRALVEANHGQKRQGQPVVEATHTRIRRCRERRGRQGGRLRSGDQAQFLAEEQQFLNDIGQLRIGPRLPRADHQVDRALQGGPERPERFTRQAPQARPGRRMTGALGDGQTQTRLSVGIPNQTRDQVEMAALGPPPALKYRVEVELVLQPVVATKRPVRCRCFAIRRREIRRNRRRQRRDHFVETDMRRRPLARRRFSTARPFLVAMRARKPWVRRRETLLGLPRPFFTLRSSVHGLSRHLLAPRNTVSSP